MADPRHRQARPIDGLLSLVRRARADRFLRQNLIFFAGSFALAFLNYLYYPILGRLMSLESFGEVQVLLSLSLQMGIFLGVLNMVALNITSNYTDAAARNRILYELQRAALYFAGTIALVALLLIRPLEAFLHFDSPWPFAVLITGTVVGVPLVIRNAFLQGRQDFSGISIAGVVQSLGKIVFSAALVIWGWQSFGAITGLVLAQFLALAYTAVRARQFGFHRPHGTNLTTRLDLSAIRPELRYGLLVLVVTLATAFLFSGDIIVVKHYFSAEAAGAYAGVATIARIIFFATSSIIGVLLPAIKIGQTAANRHVLRRSLLLFAVVAGPIELAFIAMPKFIITTLMGARYAESAHLLPLLGFAILLVALVNLFLFYFLALRRTAAAIIAAIGTAVVGLLMLTSHSTFEAVILNLIYGSLVILCLLLGWTCWHMVRKQHN